MPTTLPDPTNPEAYAAALLLFAQNEPDPRMAAYYRELAAYNAAKAAADRGEMTVGEVVRMVKGHSN
jgi:hypothetical protein